MNSTQHKFLRPCRQWTDILPIAVVILFLVLILGEVMTLPIMLITQMARLTRAVTGDPDVASFMIQYFSTIGMWPAFLLIMRAFRKNRPMLKAVGYDGKGNSLRGALIGAAVGFGMNGLCILLSALLGDIRLSFSSFDPVNLLLFLLFVCIQSGSEELAMRVYLYQKLRRRYRHPLVAVLGNAVIFTLLHAANPGFGIGGAVQIFLVALLFSIFIYYYGSFWAAVMAHTAWNFTQSILFGLPNSGVVSAYSLFKLDAATARNGFFYNVGFGIEGSVGASIVIAVMCVIFFVLGRKRGFREDLWKDAEAEAETAAKAAPAAAAPQEAAAEASTEASAEQVAVSEEKDIDN